MMAPALSETEDRLWYHHQRALVDHLWMHFIICKSISLSVEVIFSQSKVGCNQSSDSLSRISFNIFFSEFISVIGKRSLGQPCLGEAESQCTPLIIMKNLNFVKHQGWKTVQHFLVLICALAATRGSTSLWESARPNNSPQRPWHALHCLSFWQISLSLQFDFTS